MTDEQIKHMVDRFLGWHLPEKFSPDAGIGYTRLSYQKSADTMPSGTNLFDATQANDMVRHMIEGMPGQTVTAFDPVFKLLGIAAAAQSIEESKTFSDSAAAELRKIIHDNHNI